MVHNKRIIPDDLDCMIDKESFNTLIQLAEDKNIKNVMYGEDISFYKPDFSSNQIYVILSKYLLKNKGYGPRFTCKGNQTPTQVDSCSFNGIIGRFVLNGYTHNDIFCVEKNFLNSNNSNYYPEFHRDMDVLDSSLLQKSTLEQVTVSVFNDDFSKKLLTDLYGKDYIIPDK